MTPQNGRDKLSNQQLKFGYWVATHRKELRRALIGLIGTITGIVLIFLVINFVDWVTHIGQTSDIYENISVPIADYEAIVKPEDITIGRTQAVVRDEDTVDAFISLNNPNEIWAAEEVEYEIFIGSSSAGREVVAIAPQQERYFTTFLTFSAVDAPAVTVIIHRVKWSKIADRASIPVDNWDFIDPAFRYIESDQANLIYQSQLDVTLKNKSVFGFKDAEVIVIMTDEGGNVHAVGSVTLDEITSLESRDLVFRWSKRLPRGLTPIIQMSIDKITEERIIRTL